MTKRMAGAIALTLLIACSQENRTGVPVTETTATTVETMETPPASATTTGESGGTLSAMTADDKEFVVKAGMAGLYEVQAGNLALQKASSANVKAFAQRIVTDHSKANAELTELATTKGLALATELAGEHEDAVRHLASLNGAEFDKAYMEHMVPDHATAVADFEKAATSATDVDLKAWAAKTLPVLKEHAALANSTKP